MDSKSDTQENKKLKRDIRKSYDKNSVSSRKFPKDASSCLNLTHSNISFEKIIQNSKEEMKNETDKAFQTYDLGYEKYISQLEQTRKQIRLNIQTIFQAMKERHISELTDLEIEHIFEKKKAAQQPCVKENLLKQQAQTFARIKNLEEAMRLRDEANKIGNEERENKIKNIDQKYQMAFQRLENKQISEINDLQDQMILSMKAAQASTTRLIINLQKKTVSIVKNILSRQIAKCRKEAKNQTKNHLIAQILTDNMNEKIYADEKVGLFLAVQ